MNLVIIYRVSKICGNKAFQTKIYTSIGPCWDSRIFAVCPFCTKEMYAENARIIRDSNDYGLFLLYFTAMERTAEGQVLEIHYMTDRKGIAILSAPIEFS